VVVGVIILVVWLLGAGKKINIKLFSSDTPTVTITYTPTPLTPTITLTPTPTETLTPTITETPTPSGPFTYKVKEGDNCWELSLQFNVDINVLLAINGLDSRCLISPGSEILIPAPGQEMPTETIVPTDLKKGTNIEYTVKSGDTLDLIASKFGTTVAEILKATNAYRKKNNLTEITDQNSIQAGELLIIPVWIVTPTRTPVPTSTPKNTATLTPQPGGLILVPTVTATK